MFLLSLTDVLVQEIVIVHINSKIIKKLQTCFCCFVQSPHGRNVVLRISI